jgi:hypothetical protein
MDRADNSNFKGSYFSWNTKYYDIDQDSQLDILSVNGQANPLLQD